MTTGHAKRAWARMFAEHGPVLRGFFARRGANEDAEDMVQETYLRLLRAHQRQGEAIANPEAYLYTVATNLAREQAVRRKQAPLRIDEMEQFSQLLVAGEDVEDATERQQRQRRLQALLATLPARTRAVLVMQYRDGLSYKQIAERMGVSAHMVKKHVVRGLSACRRAIAEREDAW
ncbi:RNA polymerase sigma factor [Xanthomonas sp.]|uniref:RNA polymerase sigma factor n=1 Tax=Xanthomonas sp. TaxID=29446 RepID=UPI001F136C1F|nr:RNA polymerase sigma factor [Xanthomonas sp.]